MSVASKTKTKMCTTVALGLLVVLSALPTWASTSPGIISSTVQNAVVSTQTSNQDLSVLWGKLKERFSGVAEEVRSLVDGTTTPAESFHGSAIRTVDVSQGIGVQPAEGADRPAIFRQDFFVDVENDPYKTYINRLASYGVLSSSQKFYPQNYFRVDDFISLYSKLYKKTTGQSLVSQDVLGLSTTDGIMTKWVLQQAIISLQLDGDIQIDGNPYDKLIRSEGAYYLVRMFNVPALDVDEQAFPLIPNYFTDIDDHPFASAINTLASLNVLNTQSSKFYPDNYLRHYDFVIMFVNAFLRAKAQSLPNVFSSSFADVQSDANYLSQLTYAADRGLIDNIVTSRGGQLYFQPDAFMSKHEVYQMLGKALDIQFVYDRQQAVQQKISRAELTTLLVDGFGFEPQIVESDAFSGTTVDDMSLVTKLRTLLSVL